MQLHLSSVLYFLVWALAFFVMMRFGCGSHVMGHGHHHGSAGSDGAHGSNTNAVPDKTDKQERRHDCC
jgi:hypothetical protein